MSFFSSRLLGAAFRLLPVLSFPVRSFLLRSFPVRSFVVFNALVLSILVLSVLVFSGCSRDSERTTARSASKTEPPHILFIVVDTLAARHLTTYGVPFERDRRRAAGEDEDAAIRMPQKIDNSRDNSPFAYTPNIDRLAAESVVFDRAYSTSPWTKPSLASMFTSLYPRAHTVTLLQSKLPAEQYTLSERLHREGYYTAGVISHTLIRKGNGFEQGFDRYRLVPVERNVHYEITSHDVTNYALEDMKNAREAGRRLFLFLHYFDPHFNYMHHPEFDKSTWYTGEITPGMGFRTLRSRIPTMDDADRDYLVDLYHEEISYTDLHIGRVLEALRSDPYFENTIVVFTADHGEEFLEHGALGHTRTLYDELIHVPLFISWPGKLAPTSVPENVSIVDIMPSLLKLGDFPSEGIMSGKPLFDRDLQPAPEERPIFAEVNFTSSGIRAWQSGVISQGFKLIRDHLEDKYMLFDLLSDVTEQNNLIGRDLTEESSLRKELEKFLSEEFDIAEAQELVHSPEELEQLRSLGYL